LCKINGENKTAKKYIKKDYRDLSILSDFVRISITRVKWIWQTVIYSCVLPYNVEYEKHLDLLSILNYKCSRGPPWHYYE
jgi:hypothetical protein